jgi:hypothetical protein
MSSAATGKEKMDAITPLSLFLGFYPIFSDMYTYLWEGYLKIQQNKRQKICN